MQPSRPDLILILQTLSQHDVEFIVVGGVCGALHGSSDVTFDLDLVHSRNPENVARLLKALRKLDARYRDPAGRVIRPTEAHLASPGHQLLMTKGGPLDLLGEIGKHRDYEALLPDTVTFVVSKDLRVRALTLAALIKTKEEAGREKDKAGLAVLQQMLKNKRK